MSWTYLLIAGVFEIVFAVGLKYTEGFTRLVPSVITVAAGIASFLVLSQALKILPVGTGYAAWAGIGIIGASLLGAYLFGESLELPKIVCILLIIAGIIGLRVFSSGQ